MDTPGWNKFHWKLKNFCFSNLYCNSRFSSPAFQVSVPVRSEWKLYTFPNGWGPDNYVGIFLQRKWDSGPNALKVRFKICLINRRGEIHMDGNHSEEIFGKGEEWGNNEVFRRNEIKSNSDLIQDDTLTVYCEFKIIASDCAAIDYPQHTGVNYAEFQDARRVCRAMKCMYQNSLFFDVTLHGSPRKFQIHRCILEQRLPKLLHELTNSPGKIYENDEVTDGILLYAYTGKLDFKVFGWWNRRKLKEYGLGFLEERRIKLTNEIVAHTHFVIKKHKFSWEVSPEQLSIDEDEVVSETVVDDDNKISFRACLTRSGDNSWRISIQVVSDDETYLRWKVSLGEDPQFFEEREHFVVAKFCNVQCSPVLSIRYGVLYFNQTLAVFVGEYFTLDFEFTYPMSETDPISSTESRSESASCQTFEDTNELMRCLKVLYNAGAGDFVIEVGNRAFSAHKCILSARSAVFRKMLQHDMLEKRQNKVPMKSPYVSLTDEFFADVVDKFLLYIYCGKLEAPDDEFKKYLDFLIDMYLVGVQDEELEEGSAG